MHTHTRTHADFWTDFMLTVQVWSSCRALAWASSWAATSSRSWSWGLASRPSWRWSAVASRCSASPHSSSWAARASTWEESTSPTPPGEQHCVADPVCWVPFGCCCFLFAGCCFHSVGGRFETLDWLQWNEQLKQLLVTKKSVTAQERKTWSLSLWGALQALRYRMFILASFAFNSLGASGHGVIFLIHYRERCQLWQPSNENPGGVGLGWGRGWQGGALWLPLCWPSVALPSVLPSRLASPPCLSSFTHFPLNSSLVASPQPPVPLLPDVQF